MYVRFLYRLDKDLLTQYMLAANRNQGAGRVYDPRHPALLRLIARVASAACRAGKPLPVCGEIAGDAGVLRNGPMSSTSMCTSAKAMLPLPDMPQACIRAQRAQETSSARDVTPALHGTSSTQICGLAVMTHARGCSTRVRDSSARRHANRGAVSNRA